MIGARSHSWLQSAPEHTTVLALQECLAIEDCERLFEPIDLSCATALPLLVRLWLGDAALFEFSVVLHHGRKLRVCSLAVTCQLSDGFVEPRVLLSLVFHILLHPRLPKIVLLGSPVVLILCIRLLSFLLGEVFRKIRFNNLKNSDDALARTLRLLEQFWLRRLLYKCIS